jgi:predicted metal-dependent hydrolase
VELTDDPRFVRGIALFNDGDYLEASDCFEELFFEGNRDEPDFIRIFLQFSVGIFHAQTGQWRPAVERIAEGLRLVTINENDRGFDLLALATSMSAAAKALRENGKPLWPQIAFRSR